MHVLECYIAVLTEAEVFIVFIFHGIRNIFDMVGWCSMTDVPVKYDEMEIMMRIIRIFDHSDAML